MKKLLAVFFFLMIISPAFAARAADAGPAIFVSPSGNDSATGGEDAPFATIGRARDELRALKKSGALSGGATVYLRGGSYFIDKSLLFSSDDSGAADAPIVYAAYKDEEVRIIGGKKIEMQWFGPVADATVLKRFDPDVRANILQADLRAHGITDFGKLRPRGFGLQKQLAAMELFFNGKPMQLARTPNKSWAKIASVPDGQKGGRIAYSGDAPKNWAPADDIWLHGYWTYDWADSYVKVKSIDTEKRIITTEEPYGVYGYTAGRRFQYTNVIEELDSPGEWYMDRNSGMLYFWPPEKDGELIASMVEAPIISMLDASDITMRGITFEVTRGPGIEIKGGKNVLLAGCTVRNTGNEGVIIDGGANTGVTSSDIYETGESAIILSGGDRPTLTPAGNFSRNNDLHNFGRWCRTYAPGVMVRGVGNRIENNIIHDAPHAGILLNGNDHLIQYNDIYNINWETSDVGGFYLGRDWTERGNTVQFNFFHDIRAFNSFSMGVDSNGVYIDDCASGLKVYGNVFSKVARGVFIGGGRDNIVDNNIFVDASQAVIVDARCLGWASGTVVPGGTLHNRLLAMNYSQPPYSTRYPELINILDDDPGAPKGNVITHNIAYRSNFLALQQVDKNLLLVKDNMEDKDPKFIDEKKLNFQLQDDSPAYKYGFKKIPFEKIGLYIDEYRKKLPPKKDK